MAQKIPTRKAKLKLLAISVFVVLILTQIILVSAEETEDFEEIMQPLQVIYDLVKYTATLIAGLVMLFAGITYIASGSDTGKREKAKNMVMYVIIGLIVIWAAPFVVNLILGG